MFSGVGVNCSVDFTQFTKSHSLQSQTTFLPKQNITREEQEKMAFRLASGLIDWTVDKLSVLLPAQVAVASGESSDSASGEDLKHLERTMKRIQSILLDSPNDNILDCSEKLRLEELREVAYDAEDLVEEYLYDVHHAKVQAQSKMGEKVTTDLSSIDVSIPVSEEILLRAKGIRERFDEIVGEWEKLRWVESDGEKRSQSLGTVTQHPTSSLVHEQSIHGRFEDKENIISILLNASGDSGRNQTEQCVVLPIVGMGGVGKTTLAQLVYNDPRMNLLFDLKVWVYVSKEFDVQVLTQVIITSLTKKPCNLMQLDDLQRMLEKNIKGKKFLLVLDDVWNERPSSWHLLRIPFFSSSSCKILVTARNEKVAKVMQTIPFYLLKCLEQEDSWQLFKQVAFEKQDLQEHANLLEIGLEITRKCGGLPLAIKAVSSGLRFEPREEFWGAMLQSDIWEVEEGLNEVLPALRLSYDCMPENMKECFMSFALFPKNCIFQKESIVKFWSSLGFLKLESRRSAENAGSQYFDDMQQRSLLQVIKFDDKTCFFMHDLVQKLAEFVTGNTFRKLNSETLNLFSNNKCRYLSVLVNELPRSIDLSPIQQSSSLRALQVFNTVNQWLGKDISINLNERFFQNLRSVRVLNFSNTGISTLPYSIGNLKQLHFLGLARTQITTLPESIGLLYNLQTMDLMGCPLQELPKGIKNLVNLKHLIVEKWSNMHMPCGIGNLTNLEILPVFNIRSKSGCQVSDMEKLNKLREELRISGLDNVNHIMDVMLANLFNKQHIHVLILDWSHGVPETGDHSSMLVSDIDHVLVLEALQPQLNLQVLEIYHYPGLSYPKWLGDPAYSRLGKVVLFGNRKVTCKFLPPLGQLPSLRDLSIQCMLTVEYVGNEFCHVHDGQNKAFPSLDMLEFKYMPIWVYWYGARNGDFCSLKTLRIVSCNALRSLPEFLSPSLEKLVLIHCNDLATVPMTFASLTSLILMGGINKSLLVNITLPSLKSLQIGFSENIQYVMVGSMHLLEELVIKCCKNLKSLFGLTGLAFLKELELDECRSLMLPLDEHVPPFLEILKVTNCPGLSYWEKNQMKNFGDKSDKRGTGAEDGELPLLPTIGDDYNSDWLFMVAQMRKERKGDELAPTSSRKRLRNGSMNGPPNSSDKGKQICDYSSSRSNAGTTDSELDSFGGTSEEDWS